MERDACRDLRERRWTRAEVGGACRSPGRGQTDQTLPLNGVFCKPLRVVLASTLDGSPERERRRWRRVGSRRGSARVSRSRGRTQSYTQAAISRPSADEQPVVQRSDTNVTQTFTGVHPHAHRHTQTRTSSSCL